MTHIAKPKKKCGAFREIDPSCLTQQIQYKHRLLGIMNFTDTVKHFCLHQKLFSNGDRVLVGVSGGPDSVALLYTLYELRRFFGLQIYVAHLNHGLRKQAKTEQTYVETLCKSLALPFLTKTIKLKKTATSLEEIAREARLKFLINTAKKINADAIALGHHQDDLAETVLMRILRGAGPDGMRGILPQRTIYGFSVVRPFLSVRRASITKFLKHKRIKFFTDASNADKKFLRNKIRSELLPRLQKEYNPNIQETLAHLSETLSLSYDYIRRESEKLFQRSKTKSKDSKTIRVDSKKIAHLHPALLCEMIRLAVEDALGHTRKLTFTHIQEIENLIRQHSTNAVISLPFGLRITRKRSAIIFTKSSKRNP